MRTSYFQFRTAASVTDCFFSPPAVSTCSCTRCLTPCSSPSPPSPPSWHCCVQARRQRGNILFYFNVSPAGLLLHLFIFHVYINVTGMTTYEYVRAQRISTEQSQRESSNEDQQQMPKTTSTDPEGSKCECSLIMPKTNKIQPEVSLQY